MTELDLLRAVRTRLSDRARWTQDAWAKTAAGEPCLAEEDVAVCWCINGAMRRESDSLPNGVFFRAGECLEFQASKFGHTNEMSLNDDSDHATVLKMIDAAMETGEVAR